MSASAVEADSFEVVEGGGTLATLGSEDSPALPPTAAGSGTGQSQASAQDQMEVTREAIRLAYGSVIEARKLMSGDPTSDGGTPGLGRAPGSGKFTRERLQEIRSRVASGYYDRPEVLEQVARRIHGEWQVVRT